MLKIPKIEIDMNKFYTIGVWCFGIIAIMNTISLAVNIKLGHFNLTTDMISAIVSLIFNYALFGFFSYLRSTLPPSNIQATEEDMFAILNDKGGKKI